MKPLHILFWMAIASPLLALIPSRQDPSTTDWNKEVERACTAQRYGLRLAAGKKVAAAGAAAVPALIAWEHKRGRNEIPETLVAAIADQATTDTAVVELLLAWTNDREFFWRASALRGLARRATLLQDMRAKLAGVFEQYRFDPAWLVRTHARLGLWLLDRVAVTADAENDPRAVVRLTSLLLQNGALPPLQPLFDALVDERMFLGDPWGKRLGKEAFTALKTWLGDAHPLPHGQSFDDQTAGLEALLRAASERSSQALRMPSPSPDAAAQCDSGLEILSCRNGDMFVRWTTDGRLHVGVDGGTAFALPAADWAALAKERTQLEIPKDLGVVICDNMRLRWSSREAGAGPEAGALDIHVKVAPNALPEAMTKWFLLFAKVVENADHPEVASTLREKLEQFRPR